MSEKTPPRQTSVPKIKPTCGVSYLHTERPQFFAVVPLLSASVELSCSNLAALRKGNPCVAYGHHLLRWLGDSGHGGKVPGSWHGQAAKPALGKRWQPAEQPCYKNSSSSCTKFSMAGPLLAPRLAVSQVRSSPGQRCLPGHVPSGGGSAPWSPAENTVAEH